MFQANQVRYTILFRRREQLQRVYAASAPIPQGVVGAGHVLALRTAHRQPIAQ
jgi:hypothetical protein